MLVLFVVGNGSGGEGFVLLEMKYGKLLIGYITILGWLYVTGKKLPLRHDHVNGEEIAPKT